MSNVSIGSAKPRLSFWQIWNMSFGFLGIQFGFALQNANVSRIFETLGAAKDELPILWLAAPVTGLLVQPIIGYYSDRTWHEKWGRRRPFFAIGAIFATIALFLMPNSTALWMSVILLWLMDASINISMEPFRAFVGDMLPDEQRTSGFAMQSFFIGLGAVIASALPWMFTNWFGVSNVAGEGVIPDSVRWSFYLGGVAYFCAVMWTVFNTEEYPPDDIEALREENASIGIWGGLYESFVGIFKMPKTMVQLSFVQFFSWFALFAMWIYTTSAVTSHVYGTERS
ncbi:MAG: MFS transporter, partial [Bacteroidota bacterium]